MQTSLARRQRHRRLGTARRPRGSAAVRRTIIAIPFLIFALFLSVGVAGFLGVVAAYSYYSQGLPDPKVLLTALVFDQQTTIMDRSGKQELARLGERKREVVNFADIPPEVIDATTAIEDKDFWSNPGFDLGGFVSATVDTLNGRPRGGSTITQQLVRQRLLPPSAFDGSREERKIREIIQSLRLTQAFPGVEGKQQIITAYLNQNFYGDQSYGIAAAAQTYFKKDLKDLTLAQEAILAAIPQSPTKFDLTQNAEQICTKVVPEGADCPKTQLVVPADSEIVVRRNYILDRMKTESTLSKNRHTVDDYEKAKLEPVVLAAQDGVTWLAPQFVWQVREQLATILCPGATADTCEKIDTGGYRVTTTLDMKMQRTTENWVYAAAIAPNRSNALSALKNLKIPSGDRSWLLALRNKNIHNGAAAVMDYRTGQVLAYVGSGSYRTPGNKKFQPQFDVLSKGWRQPGSSIKPLNYAIGIDDQKMTAATMFMDVTTNFGGRFIPTQADHYERGPVRLRSALQFSLNIPSIKAGIINGLDHFFQRSADFGVKYVPGALPVVSMGIGTLEVHPIDLLGGYGTLANGGVLMPRTMILSVVDSNGNVVYPDPAAKPIKGKRVVSPQTAYIITDILAGNTEMKTNPFWGKWAVYNGSTRRPAAYKTGTTSDNRDVLAFGYLAPPADKKAPALAVGVWMGNSNNDPNSDTLSLSSSAPLWSRIMRDVSRGMPIANFKRPSGLVDATVDAFTGMKPGPFTRKTVKEMFIKGTQPTQIDDMRRNVDVDSATGLLWANDCAGPKKTIGVLDFSQVESAFPTWNRYDRAWAKRAARGPGVGGGLKASRTSYFYGGGPPFYPFGRTWGGTFAPSKTCKPPAPVTPPPCVPDPILGLPCPSGPPDGGGGGKPSPKPKP